MIAPLLIFMPNFFDSPKQLVGSLLRETGTRVASNRISQILYINYSFIALFSSHHLPRSGQKWDGPQARFDKVVTKRLIRLLSDS